MRKAGTRKVDKNSGDNGHTAQEHPGLNADNRLTRRTFLRTVAASAAVLLTSACGGGGGAGGTDEGGGGSGGGGGVTLPPPNDPPVWSVVPPIIFTQGVAATFSIAAYVSDAENDDLEITRNDVPLPAGVTYDAATKSFIYDGVGAAAATDGHILTATEG
jgi:hypothetical protein